MGSISGKNFLGRWTADLVNYFSPSREAVQKTESEGIVAVGHRDPLSEQTCKELFEKLQNAFSWQWDDRFGMPLAQIKIEEKEAILKILDKYMDTPWDSSTIKKAPEALQSLVKPLGGIQSGQLLFTAALPNEGIVFCAWWPWNNGQTISVRMVTSPEDSALLSSLVPPGPI